MKVNPFYCAIAIVIVMATVSTIVPSDNAEAGFGRDDSTRFTQESHSMRRYGRLTIIIDKETNCKYIAHRETVTPLLNKDGKPSCGFNNSQW